MHSDRSAAVPWTALASWQLSGVWLQQTFTTTGGPSLYDDTSQVDAC